MTRFCTCLTSVDVVIVDNRYRKKKRIIIMVIIDDGTALSIPAGYEQ